MSLPVFARLTGLVGGVCWILRALLDGPAPPGLVDALHWAGLVLLAVSLVCLGAELVSSSAAWLRVIVAICLPALVWSVLEALRGGLPDRWVEGAFGLLLGGYCLVGLLRAPTRRSQRPHGTHAK